MNVFTEMTKSLSPSAYRVFRSNSGGKNFGYFLAMAVIGFIITIVVGVYMQLVGVVGIAEKLPEFSMSEAGMLTTDLKIDTEEYGERYVINTDYDYTYDEATGYVVSTDEYGAEHAVIDANDGESRFLVIGKSAAITKDSDGVEVIRYADMDAEMLTAINKDTLIELINKWIAPCAVIVFLLVAIRLAFWNLINTLMAACISSTMGVKNTFGQLYAMSLRAYTVVYFVKCILFALWISIPFKTILGLLVTGFVLSRGIKNIKKQLDDEEKASMAMDSDLAFRAMYGENGMPYNDDINN